MLIAKSPAMKPVLELIEKAQLSGATVLLRGDAAASASAAKRPREPGLALYIF